MNTSTVSEYQVSVTPSFDENLRPVYRFVVIHNRPAGISGPMGHEGTIYDIDELDSCLAVFGLERQGWFSEICSNGFATVAAVKI